MERPRNTLKKLQTKKKLWRAPFPEYEALPRGFQECTNNNNIQKPIWVDLESKINATLKACDHLSQYSTDM